MHYAPINRKNPDQKRTTLLAIFFFCTFLLCCFSACENTISYFPLKKKLHSHYQIKIHTMNGSRLEKYSIQNQPPIKNETLILYPRQTGDDARIFYRQDENWIYRHASQTVNGKIRLESPPIKILPKTPSIGMQWLQRSRTFLLEKSGPPQDTLFKIQEPINLHFSIAAMDERIQVPAGVFENCLRVEATGKRNANVGNYVGKITITIRQTHWYAPGVGLIKSERTEQTDNASINKGRFIMERIP